MIFDATTRVRFLKKVCVDPVTSCWMWNATFSQVYGTFYIEGKPHKAHRISYEMHIGKIPTGLFVLHKCDTTKCVNPDHLFLGTHQDNSDDKIKKGRCPKGADAYHWKGGVTKDMVTYRKAWWEKNKAAKAAIYQQTARENKWKRKL